MKRIYLRCNLFLLQHRFPARFLFPCFHGGLFIFGVRDDARRQKGCDTVAAVCCRVGEMCRDFLTSLALLPKERYLCSSVGFFVERVPFVFFSVSVPVGLGFCLAD